MQLYTNINALLLKQRRTSIHPGPPKSSDREGGHFGPPCSHLSRQKCWFSEGSKQPKSACCNTITIKLALVGNFAGNNQEPRPMTAP